MSTQSAFKIFVEKKNNCMDFVNKLINKYDLNNKEIQGETISNWMDKINKYDDMQLLAMIELHLLKYKGMEKVLIRNLLSINNIELKEEELNKLIKYIKLFFVIVQANVV
eukprot:TRINITY_DN4164_c0_g2_i10.p1 TRINITY_DN4164_c0_g2~~TRINITY_DN4164_c0_g2_i10.p1  ORF type:complete len:110 (+),score=16.89 TRINITY_DN4164_c0_g2_i10:622-951(+)